MSKSKLSGLDFETLEMQLASQKEELEKLKKKKEEIEKKIYDMEHPSYAFGKAILDVSEEFKLNFDEQSGSYTRDSSKVYRLRLKSIRKETAKHESPYVTLGKKTDMAEMIDYLSEIANDLQNLLEQVRGAENG